MINGATAGLTTGYPLQTFEHHASLDPAQVAAELDEDESSEAPSEPFIFNEDDDKTNDTSSASSLPLHVGIDDSRADEVSTALDNESFILDPPLMSWQLPRSVIFPLPTGKSTSFDDKSRNDHDWALLDDLPPAIRSRANRQTPRVHNIVLFARFLLAVLAGQS
ncbi:hypothetical protein XANCAGTX0491_006052 [Xanthoria calcicola]